MRFSLILGGGGLRGLAHIGVLEALEAQGLTPFEIIGNSTGSLIGAAWCNGIPIAELKDMAFRLERSDLFRIARAKVAFKRLLSPSLYYAEPLENLVQGLLGNITFESLPRPLVVNTVDINSGMQVLWGLPGLRDVRVADAVYASCALPGMLPPREIRGRYYVDGAALDNLPVAAAARHPVDFILAIDIGASSVLYDDTQERGFAVLYSRAAEIMMQRLSELYLQHWKTPPLVLVQPRVEHVSIFSFSHHHLLVEEGRRAINEVLDSEWFPPNGGSGIYPRKQVVVGVDEDRCIGCRACLFTAPSGLFAINEQGKAQCTQPEQEWSPLDGGFVRHCPTYAITARPATPEEASPTPG